MNLEPGYTESGIADSESGLIYDMLSSRTYGGVLCSCVLLILLENNIYLMKKTVWYGYGSER